MTYPSGRVITYNYSNDRAISVLNNASNLATSITYKPFGGVSSMTYGNSVVGTIGYDNQYRVSSITAGTVMTLSYDQYDANANIQHITNSLDSTKNKSFTYDTLDRLATATSSGIWGSLAWTYDGVGNRQTEGSTVYTYTAGTNKLTGVGGQTYNFDSDGNTTADGTRGYTYNQNQRMTQAVNGATTANYTYNGNGQRVKKVVGGTTTVFHYTLSGQIIAESDNTGTISAEYVYLNGQPMAKIEGTNTYYYHNDHLGTPQKMTDASGTVVWSADYKPFGEVTFTVSTITNNLRFPGQYFDAETGLNYNLNRDYNQIIGRYIEADPIGQVGGINLYSYVNSRPTVKFDLLGLSDSPSPIGGGIGAEGHFIYGYGRDTHWCCDGKNRWRIRTSKHCLGAGFAVSGGGTMMAAQKSQCPDGYAGWTFEYGYGPFEGGIGITNPLTNSSGVGGGIGGKITLCYYIILEKDIVGCCK
jgi:RHS repeat-associated protein